MPASLFPAIRERVVGLIAQIRIGDVADFRNFMGAVIDKTAFEKIGGYLALARSDSACSILAGGGASDETGYFVQPTFVETKDPAHRLMKKRSSAPC